MIDHIETNIVLMANQFNLSILQQIWLVENSIIQKEEFGMDSFFSPMAVNVKNTVFDFLVIPDRLQVDIIGKHSESEKVFDRVVGGIVKALPHTPYLAVGFNFSFLVYSDKVTNFGDLSRRLCLREDSPLSGDFGAEDARFGISLSKDFIGTNLRVRVSPDHRGEREVFLVKLNFHKNLVSVGQIAELISRWNEMFDYSNSVIKKINNFIEES